MSEQISKNYIPLIRSHLDAIIATGTDVYGPEHTSMWMSCLDIHTGRYPLDDSRPPHIGKRVYRSIDAPKGSSLYWDQPLVVAAHNLSQLTSDPRYQEAADAYVTAFLGRCVAANGMFLWGNHYYYDAYRDLVLWFKGEEEPRPVDMVTENGWLHEMRPFSPAWETFWRISPQATERAIRQLGQQHLFDTAVGGFNRHADGRRSHAFLEAGGVLIETLAWLWTKTRDPALSEMALRMARFSWGHRGPETNLVENSPVFDRWDKYVCTTEVGLWASSLVRAADLTGVAEFQAIARQAVAAYLERGYDAEVGRYFGRLRVADGAPERGLRVTLYQPDVHSDLWNALFPIHDYPMSLAESCLALYQRTRDDLFLEGVRRWIRIIEEEIPARGGRGAYAEHYGRCIHFLCGAAQGLASEEIWDLANRVADEALSVLYAQGMFRGHPGEDRYDAVDGVGFLMLGLLYLHTGAPPDLMGLGL